MIYGLYLSANGVLANSFRQDVIANNLANVDDIGFKRDISTFQQRFSEAQLSRTHASNPLMDNIGGGLLLSPIAVDLSQGEFEPTGNNLDAAIQGSGYFAVSNGKDARLTRAGRFAFDREGYLVLANDANQRVLDRAQKPIKVDPTKDTNVAIGLNGELTQAGQPLGTIGIFDVADPIKLAKQGRTLLHYTGDGGFTPSKATLRSEFIERANVDPANEMTALMEAQRQLEANANMIRYQDTTLGRLVNDVGKIS